MLKLQNVSLKSDKNLGFKNTNTNDKTVSEKVHIRIRQRNGRKRITIIQNLSDDLSISLKDILKDLKKSLCCNGCIDENEKYGTYIKISGDQREEVKKYLVEKNLVDAEKIKIHGN